MSGSEGESFEDLYRRLEVVVAKMEAGGLILEEAVTLYEEGMGLYRRCQEMLDAAQLRITQLQSGLTTAEEEPLTS